jgi:hypothetical protein
VAVGYWRLDGQLAVSRSCRHCLRTVGGRPMLLPHLFDRTQFGYWRKSLLNYNTYWILTVLLGWFAIDQLYLRSPLTFVAKLVGNIFLFGIPYIYDVLQASLNQNKVKLYGTSAPILGQIGAGAGMFYDKAAPMSAVDKDRQWNFMIYALLLFATGIFGGESYFIGERMTGIIRTFMCLSIIFLPLAVIWWGYSLWQFFWKTEDVLDYHWQFFGAPKPERPIPLCPGILEQITIWVLETGKVIAEQIPGLNLIVLWLATIIQQLKVAYGFVAETVEAVAEAAPAVESAVQSVGSTEGFPAAVADERAAGQSGGAAAAQDATGLKPVGYGLIGLIVLIVVSGGTKFLNRVRQNVRSERSSKGTDDSPPEPGAI